MRAAAYRRVSSEEQIEGFSLEAQRKAIERYCKEQGLDLIADFCDPGFSARTDDRPAFKRMIASAKQGRFDGIVVHRLDRFSRDRSHFAIYRALLDRAGVQLISISEPARDDAAGQFITGILECAAEFYSMRLSEETRKGKRARAEAGFWNGDPPIGYCRGLCENCQDPNGPGYCPHVGEPDRSDGRVLIPHPRDHKAVQMAYRVYVSGEASDRDIAEILNREGYRTNHKRSTKPNPKQRAGPGPFRRDTVRGMLVNPFYIGFTTYKGRLIEGQHPAIIEAAEFERVQQMRALLRTHPRNRRRPARVYPLTGLLYCAKCSEPYYGSYSKSAKRRYYRDNGPYQGHSQCRPAFLRADELEDQIGQLMASLELPQDWERQVRLYYAGWESLEDLKEKRAALSARKQRIVDLYKAGMLPQHEMEQESAQIRAEEDKLNPKRLRKCQELAPLVIDFAEIWKAATQLERKEILHLIFQRIEARGDHIVTLQPTPAFYPLVVTAGGLSIEPHVTILPPSVQKEDT